MSYDNGNEMLNLNTTTYNYDLNGNRTQKIETGTNTTYTYDDENRLTRVEITGGAISVITYAYDPFGRRIEKNVNGTITKYLYDKEAIILEYNQAGTVTARYIHGPGIYEPFALEKNSQIYYYHADGLGSIVALTNASGTVAQAYTYDSFGNITSGIPTITQPYTYTAREYDSETGMYFYRARYYDPKAGRFITKDPIGFRGGVNLYAYAQNNPVDYIDPFGLKECFWYGFSADVTIGIGWELIVQKGKCKNECGEWEDKTRNCVILCAGLSAGGSFGGGFGDDSTTGDMWEFSFGKWSLGGGPSGGRTFPKPGGGSIGPKIGVKKCWYDCDIF